LRRVYHPAIHLPDTSREEFSAVLTQVHSELGIDADTRQLAEVAESSGLNMRWVQNYVSNALASRTKPLRLTSHLVDFSAQSSQEEPWDLSPPPGALSDEEEAANRALMAQARKKTRKNEADPRNEQS
jgi:hypothetical protein